uniref:Uncharacterized protein n=1 Tax=Octopus bimaculoides TaxID=37653 RepID=A0A0L8IAS7_OCTBM
MVGSLLFRQSSLFVNGKKCSVTQKSSSLIKIRMVS